jgi:hypothetical protein
MMEILTASRQITKCKIIFTRLSTKTWLVSMALWVTQMLILMLETPRTDLVYLTFNRWIALITRTVIVKQTRTLSLTREDVRPLIGTNLMTLGSMTSVNTPQMKLILTLMKFALQCRSR